MVGTEQEVTRTMSEGITTPDWSSEWHLRCNQCNTNPTIALDDNGTEFIVCHCTHVDGTIEPVPLEMLFERPDVWEWYRQAGGDAGDE